MTAAWDLPIAVPAVLALVGAWSAARGARLLAQGMRRPDESLASLRVVRGLRAVVVGLAAGALAGGLFFAQTWLLVFGVVFLAEELYETAVLALILRSALRAGPAGPSP